LGAAFPDKGNKVRTTGPIALAIDGNADTAWTTDGDPGRRNQAQEALFKLAEPLAVTPEMTLAVRMGQLHGGWNSDNNQNNNIGRFRISVTDAEALPDTVIPLRVQTALENSDEATLFSYWRTTVPELARVNQRIDGLWQSLPDGATQLALQERSKPRRTHRLNRGDFLSPEEAVAPGVPEFLHALNKTETPTRLDFARWLTSPESPTTARAYVNRVWQRYFGTGIVSTTADLGVQGEAPSHQALLDWLSVDFMESGWRIKGLHRLIVSSATYRQDSTVSPALLEHDPGNRLFARGARFRVEGEAVRDIALAASGLLNPKVGGPSVYPPAPEFLFLPPASYGPKLWRQNPGTDAYRRALYTFRFRSVPYPALQVFDTPSGEAPCTGRDRSNSPLQALTLLNEPLFQTSALHLAESTLAEGGDDDRSRIAYAFRRCVTRPPDVDEVDAILAFLGTQRARIDAGSLDPAVIVESNEGGEIDQSTLAAWTLTARVILNLDETIVRQ
jgi:hypothetical protein